MFKVVIYENTDSLFSPNGAYMAIAGEKALVRVWDVNTWQEICCLKHERKVKAIAFSPNSQYLAMASFDKTSIWRLSDFLEVSRITYNEDVRALSFSPDGKYLATSKADGSTTIWLWQPDDLISEACKRLSRNLTEEEWEQFLGSEPYQPTCPNINER